MGPAIPIILFFSQFTVNKKKAHSTRPTKSSNALFYHFLCFRLDRPNFERGGQLTIEDDTTIEVYHVPYLGTDLGTIAPRSRDYLPRDLGTIAPFFVASQIVAPLPGHCHPGQGARNLWSKRLWLNAAFSVTFPRIMAQGPKPTRSPHKVTKSLYQRILYHETCKLSKIPIAKR